MKKRILSALFMVSLLGTTLSTNVLANDRFYSTRTINGTKVNVLASETTSASSGNSLIGIQGELLTPDKQAIINRINAIRKEAADEGLATTYVPIKWSTALEQTAITRAAEASITMGHVRLSNKNLQSAFPNVYTYSENLAWNYGGFMAAIQQWYAEKADYIKQQNGETPSGQTGHYESLINPEYTHMGLAAFDNPAHSRGWTAVAQSLANSSGDSESLVGDYGPTILYTEALTSRVQEISTKANLFDESYNVIGTHVTKTGSFKTRGSQSVNFSTRNPAEFLKFLRTQLTRTAVVGNWKQSGNSWWYQYTDGNYATGWKQIDGNWYFFDNAGWMKTGWVSTNGSWYYMNSTGIMKTGWLKSGNSWYFLDNSGQMQTGWLYTGGSWYYLDNSGAMKTGWLNIDGKWYYAYDSGALAFNTTTPDGYTVNNKGELV